MDERIDVSIIIVSFNTCDLLRNAIQAVLDQTRDVTFEIIVVDNDSKDGSAKMVEEEFPNVKLIASKENNGFAKGNNLALPLVEGKTIFYLNPDTILLNNAVRILYAFLMAHPAAGIVGPRLFRNVERTHHPSIRQFTRPNNILFRFSPGYRHWEKFAEKYLIARDKVQRADWLMGAALLGHTDVIKELGGFDEAFFVYSEEEDLCRRLWEQKHLETWYCPEAEVAHLWGGSSRQAPHIANKFFWDSQMTYLNRYYPPRVVAQFVTRFTRLLKLKSLTANADKKAFFGQIIEIIHAHCPKSS